MCIYFDEKRLHQLKRVSFNLHKLFDSVGHSDVLPQLATLSLLRNYTCIREPNFDPPLVWHQTVQAHFLKIYFKSKNQSLRKNTFLKQSIDLILMVYFGKKFVISISHIPCCNGN